jgi:hypothetical protein
VAQTVTVTDTTPPSLTTPDPVTVEQTGRDGTPVTLVPPTATDICDANPAVTGGVVSSYRVLLSPSGTQVAWMRLRQTPWPATFDEAVAAGANVTEYSTCPTVFGGCSCSGWGTQVPCETDFRVHGYPDDVMHFISGHPYTAGPLKWADGRAHYCVVWPKDSGGQVLRLRDLESAGTGVPEVFPLGETIVTWKATDASGNSASVTQEVTVADTTVPSCALSVLQPTLWPVNHKLVLAAKVMGLTDVCDAEPTVAITVSASEPIKGPGSGNTSPDWQVVRNGDVWEIWLRAERAGSSTERDYYIKAVATDASGNAAEQNATVVVPHDQGRKQPQLTSASATAEPSPDYS